MTELDNFYSTLEEPLQSTLLALRSIILNIHPDITPEWKYKLPFFYYKKKPFCYLWKDRKTQEPYIGVIKGKFINHPDLVLNNRKQIPIMPLKSNKDLPLEKINFVLNEALKHYK
jgi:hypothetical protein